jgi:HD-like signal output (HDOD) protein
MKRVLFVDDDPGMLDGLRTRFRRMRNVWEMEFVASGAAALERLERQAFDVIVTDQRMPEMDGATLLQTVLERWPHCIRIVLSGYAEPEQILRLVPVAHQYVSKPCDPEQLECIVERCTALQAMLRQPVLRELVGRMGAVPTAPRTFAELQRAMSSETVSVDEIAALVERDTLLAAKVLQIVNSGFFRVPRRIQGLKQAVAYLGLNTVRSLVVSAEVFSKWAPPSSHLLSLDTLQAHATQTAAAVVSLVKDPTVANDALMAALLHDIGYIVLSHGCPDELMQAQRLSIVRSLPMDEAEREILGASHAEIGAYLLGVWGFPTSIVEAVAYHHRPLTVGQPVFDALSAVCIAHALVEPAESAVFPGLTANHSEVPPEYVGVVHAPFTWDEARERVRSDSSFGKDCI